MKIRLKHGVYVRHCGEESLIWCPRSAGCTVLQSCRPFLEEIGWKWRDEEAIIEAISRKYQCECSAVRDDYEMLRGDLMSQRFADFAVRSQSGNEDHVLVDTSGLRPGREGKSDEFPFVSFCKRHKIPAELHIDLTDACTERCVHCYVPHGQQHYLSLAMVEKALSEFRAMNGLTVHLTGGEAMMHPDFGRVCKNVWS